jgi:hypothetical protein
LVKLDVKLGAKLGVNMEKEKPKWQLKRLKSMYFAMHCWKCKKWEISQEKYKQECEDNIQKIIDNLEIKEMTFRDFNNIIKNTTFCKFEKRDFSNNCPICKKLGITNNF